MDFIVTWVDGNDPDWRKEYSRYKEKEEGDASVARFRDWDNLKYWFRGVNKFAPWVDKIHFVTCGHLPSWLNINHPKLNIVRHQDYIPEEYLPTFNSRTIDLNFHRIEDLSEEYVYFNDDMFLIDHVKPDYFFKNGKPCARGVFNIMGSIPYDLTLFHNIFVINHHFNKWQTVKKAPFNWLNLKYGKGFIKNMALTFGSKENFPGFESPHLPKPYLKSTTKEIWAKAGNEMARACSFRFRNINTVNEYLQGYWQLASNNFYPADTFDIGKSFQLGEDKSLVNEAVNFIKNQRKSIICVNDQPSISAAQFQDMKEAIMRSFESILPEKSEFEK